MSFTPLATGFQTCNLCVNGWRLRASTSRNRILSSATHCTEAACTNPLTKKTQKLSRNQHNHCPESPPCQKNFSVLKKNCQLLPNSNSENGLIHKTKFQCSCQCISRHHQHKHHLSMMTTCSWPMLSNKLRTLWFSTCQKTPFLSPHLVEKKVKATPNQEKRVLKSKRSEVN